LEHRGRPSPHPVRPRSAAPLRAAADAVQRWAFTHFASILDQQIGATATPGQLRPALDLPPPNAGRPFEEILADFRRHVEPFAFRTNHPRFLAFVPGVPCFPSILGDWL